ncbi:alpha/beta hydrolase family protein [Leptospira yanagawae serovar Saopaulo str. Sao Paulo = ATCC 700523]|uniref:Alpha/beta hydrolase family protein n=1 Tax=Leptospira yanagawae serovar Saopaulo str. Sao Paulo = ATCC 700523 TaxID=1249483 RepID=A0A5E8HCN0_9LEPT|nr:alpha/beta hydrolase [Leptospira yanagawae]EOQ88974.1 alpha/beta hydrolase family protein [Leptospira yanagawae serovar Saopaulo str. Sao Paulo = ATCC 700523]
MEGFFENAIEFKKNGKYLKFNNHSIFYNSVGEGETLLLLHGYPFNSYDWNWLLNDLSKKYQVIYFDFLGMGFSDKPKEHQYSFEEYVEILKEVIKVYQLRSIRILAHDLAVSVVQELIASEETLDFRILSVAFMNGGLFTDVYKPRLIQRLLSQSPNWMGKWISKKMSRSAVESSIHRVFGPQTQPNVDLLENYWNILNYKDGKQIAYLIGRLVFDKVKYQTRWINALKNTKIPFCYICGPFDPNSGTHMAERFQIEYPNRKVYFLSNLIGHWPQVESPLEVLSAYQLFLKDIEHNK